MVPHPRICAPLADTGLTGHGAAFSMGEALPRPTGTCVLGAKAGGRGKGTGRRGSPLAAASASPRPASGCLPCPALRCRGSSCPPSGLPPLHSIPPLNYHDFPNLCASKRLLGPQICSPQQ